MPGEISRLDQALTALGYFSTREQARRALLAGEVEVNGSRLAKPGQKISLKYSEGGGEPSLVSGGKELQRKTQDAQTHVPVARVLAVPEEAADAAQPSKALKPAVRPLHRKDKLQRSNQLLRRCPVDAACVPVLVHQIPPLDEKARRDATESHKEAVVSASRSKIVSLNEEDRPIYIQEVHRNVFLRHIDADLDCHHL